MVTLGKVRPVAQSSHFGGSWSRNFDMAQKLSTLKVWSCKLHMWCIMMGKYIEKITHFKNEFMDCIQNLSAVNNCRSACCRGHLQLVCNQWCNNLICQLVGEKPPICFSRQQLQSPIISISEGNWSNILTEENATDLHYFWLRRHAQRDCKKYLLCHVFLCGI